LFSNVLKTALPMLMSLKARIFLLYFILLQSQRRRREEEGRGGKRRSPHSLAYQKRKNKKPAFSQKAL
jgi:hypothetical protein